VLSWAEITFGGTTQTPLLREKLEEEVLLALEMDDGPDTMMELSEDATDVGADDAAAEVAEAGCIR
jgi:hypothetical protein